ncbi:MAG: hypothetical protein JST28_08955 [Acidobacteria bacterium]|nr:hypothetical protein [Acidobacteriota bacterium]
MSILKPFAAAEVRYFCSGETNEARDWLEEILTDPNLLQEALWIKQHRRDYGGRMIAIAGIAICFIAIALFFLFKHHHDRPL